jgi:hypothetical protein
MTRLGVMAATLLVGGCAAAPTVDYHLITAGAYRDDAVPFRLTDSSIVIGATAAIAASDDAGKLRVGPPISFDPGSVRCTATGCPGTTALIAPVDFTDATYALIPRSRRLVSTIVTPVYVPNSLRLASLGIEVKDHRLEAINTIGAIAGGFAKLAASENQAMDADIFAKLSLPIVIDAADARSAVDSGAKCSDDPGLPCHEVPNNIGWSYRLRRLDDGNGFRPRATIGDVHGAMVASACQRARLTLEHRDARGALDGIRATLVVTLADPDWLITMPLPPKGQMLFHTLCGIDMKREATSETGTDVLATAVFANIDAVRTAQHK